MAYMSETDLINKINDIEKRFLDKNEKVVKNMKDFRVTMDIRAENKSDAEELINDYTGQETDIKILEVFSKEEYKRKFGKW